MILTFHSLAAAQDLKVVLGGTDYVPEPGGAAAAASSRLLFEQPEENVPLDGFKTACQVGLIFRAFQVHLGQFAGEGIMAIVGCHDAAFVPEIDALHAGVTGSWKKLQGVIGRCAEYEAYAIRQLGKALDDEHHSGHHPCLAVSSASFARVSLTYWRSRRS